MEKEIYFHVGLAKTGSTFLQKNVFPKLHGIKYISTHKYKNCIDLIIKEKHKKILISREFDRQFEKEVKWFTSHFPNTKIIVVFRRHDQWISSQYKRFVKNGYSLSFDQFYDIENDSGFWKNKEMIYKNKILLIKKYSPYKPLVLFYDEIKTNPYNFIDRIVKYTKSTYKKDSISLNVVHKSYNEKQLLFLRSYCRIFKKTPPTYYENNKLLHWLIYRPWWLFFHLLMYLALFIPKSIIVKKPLIEINQLQKIKEKYTNDWNHIKRLKF